MKYIKKFEDSENDSIDINDYIIVISIDDDDIKYNIKVGDIFKINDIDNSTAPYEINQENGKYWLYANQVRKATTEEVMANKYNLY